MSKEFCHECNGSGHSPNINRIVCPDCLGTGQPKRSTFTLEQVEEAVFGIVDDLADLEYISQSLADSIKRNIRRRLTSQQGGSKE